MEDVYLHVPIDAFAAMFPECKLDDREICASAAPRLFEGYYRSVVALVLSGNKVIVDTVDHEHPMKVFDALFRPFEVMYVAVRCPLEELERRELARGDRSIGLARRQFAEVHQFLRYDVEVDTHAQNAKESVALIKQFINNAMPSVDHK